MNDQYPTPEPVIQLAERCSAHIEHRLGVTLDYREETFSILDGFIAAVLDIVGALLYLCVFCWRCNSVYSQDVLESVYLLL